MSTDYSHADIGIVAALPMELSAFLGRCERPNRYKAGGLVFRGGRYDGIRVAVVEAGMGFVRARKATSALIDGHSPDWVLSCGFSGALLPEMQIGQIVMANSIVDQHGQELRQTLNAASNPAGGLYVGRILTADEMIRTVDEKRELAEKHGAIAVDLESLAVAQIARERHKNFMAIRVISDDMSADLPPEVLSVVGSTGAIRFGAALGSLVKRPESAKEMWHLRGNAKAAAESLATFLDGVVHQLCTGR
ncbi:5'-methylthioadenosine nucleosidase [bacterium]|nr:5'-methylthioadenosine nucleosidase [bacterium]